MDGAKPRPTPTSIQPLVPTAGSPFEDVTLYRSTVGALQYLTLTRPNVAFEVNKVCQFMHSSTTDHWAAVKRILRYLKEIIGLGIQIQPSTTLKLVGFSDADWAGSPHDH
ncbi:uncharacterized mitochondrial protein AtMg00810-like [Telopea speciosissima]|uniref:uncharacterized mitochondrial protein AtMg00810-like n=1 Tax=Telopea speciosissima TaxID=54955 RepID=UPI001CC37762|nr:uncharacterized mitochondrial protein AtMg00810-like [Telopea speciosissima]